MNPTVDTIIQVTLLILFLIAAFGANFIFCMTRLQRRYAAKKNDRRWLKK
jgi:hypothetical protein